MSSHGRYPLSAFSAELLARARQKLGGAAFGRLAQELLVCALRDLHPGLHDNRGAGTPDATANEGGVHWTWEFKSTEGEEVTLDETCARGLATAGGSDPRPRLVVLDVAFPAGLWVLEGAGLAAGPFRPDAHPSVSERTRRRHSPSASRRSFAAATSSCSSTTRQAPRRSFAPCGPSCSTARLGSSPP